MEKTTYEPQDGDYGAFSSIANAQYVLAEDFRAMSDAEGFVSLSLSDHLGSSSYIPKEIGSRYMYNKAGEVKSLRTGKILKIHHNEFEASCGGTVYKLYMPKNSILASRVEPMGENDDIIFRTIKSACEHFKCNYRTIKACLS